jgi:Leucine-rich repeat (LRR) protein
LPIIGFGQKTYVPDDNFEYRLIILGYDNILDDSVTTSNINTVTYLYLVNFQIYDLTGIEDFTALTTLYCYKNNLTTLDLSSNTALENLSCYENQLISINLSQNTALKQLACADNSITSLDLSNCPSLELLSCYSNSLTSLNIANGNNTNLSEISVIYNPNLICIDVDDVAYSTANWTGINYYFDAQSYFSNNCFFSLQQSTYVPDNNFEQELINLGYDTVLDDSVATNNIITVTYLNLQSLFISDLTGIKDFIALTELYCNNNQLSSLDISNNIALTKLYCNDNQITSLDVSNNIALTTLGCNNNNLISLDLSTNSNLNYLFCHYNQLTNLDVNINTSLLSLDCSYNQITSLDITNNPLIYSLKCRENQLTSLDMRNGNNTIIWSFYAFGNNDLFCIDVDSVSWASGNWTSGNSNIDAIASFSTNCSTALGCTDSLACNYDLLVTINDSSCIYPGIWQQGFPICDGDSVMVGTSIYETTGNYTDTLTSYNGCDSIVYTSINVIQPVIWQQAFPICYGDSILVGTSIYDTAGNYIDTLTAGNGCDSIVYTNIIIASPTTWYQTLLICDGDSIAVGNNIYDTAGVYMDTLNASNGCDSVVHTYLMIDENTSSYDTLSVAASIVWNGSTLSISGDYSVNLINSIGCDSLVNLNLTVTTTEISEIVNNKSNLIKITDMLGQETPYKRNTPLFYIYDDGTVEKRIVIE